jgi:hypothetical protein
VVLTSSDADATSAQGARSLGATGFVPKTELADGSLHTLLTPHPS